jgi:GTP-binding protein EngB required for normal cell division
MYKELYTFLMKLTPDFLDDSQLLPIREKIKDLALVDPEKLQVVLMGEFKAGKSSLINAIIKKNYAPSDILEMTSWIARYVKAEEVFCRLVFQDKSTQLIDLEEFLQKCEQRCLSNTLLQKLAYVDIGLPEAPAALVLVDTPGLGTIRHDNAQRLLEALQQADIMLWILDATAIGSLNDAAVFSVYQELGLEVFVVITKMDLITSEDFQEIQRYLQKTYAIDKQKIIGVSAQKALLAENAKESGIDFLLEKLEKLHSEHNRLRNQSYLAHQQHLREQALICLNQAEAGLLALKQEFSQGIETIKNVGKSVSQDLEVYSEKTLVYAPLQPAYGHLSKAIHNLLDKKALSEETLSQAFQETQKTLHLEAIWDNFKGEIISRLENSWKDRLFNQPLPPIWKQLIVPKGHELKNSMTINAHIATTLPSTNQDQTLNTSLQTTAAIAGVTSIFSLASGQVAATAVLSTVALPLVVIGGVVSAGLFLLKQQDDTEKKTQQAQQIAHEILKRYENDLIEQGLKSQIYPLIQRYNDQIVIACNQALETQYPQSKNLSDLLKEIVRWKELLAQPELNKDNT